MREVIMRVYEFDELPKNVQEKILEDNRFILVDDCDWYYGIYDAAKALGFEIVAFDIDRRYIEVKLKTTVLDSIEKALKFFAEGSRPYDMAKGYYDEIMKLADSDKVRDYLKEYPNESVHDAIYDLSLDDQLYDDYVKDMGKEFLRMLEVEYEYLISDEAITNFLEANGFEFYRDGRIFEGGR